MPIVTLAHSCGHEGKIFGDEKYLQTQALLPCGNCIRDRIRRIAAETPRPDMSRFGIYGYNEPKEDGDFVRFLEARGTSIISISDLNFGTFMGGAAQLVQYESGGSTRYAYVIHHRGDIDLFEQEVLIMTQKVDREYLLDVAYPVAKYLAWLRGNSIALAAWESFGFGRYFVQTILSHMQKY